ncbi:hypothetical protein D3C72_2450730 [compost metagenome]
MYDERKYDSESGTIQTEVKHLIEPLPKVRLGVLEEQRQDEKWSQHHAYTHANFDRKKHNHPKCTEDRR